MEFIKYISSKKALYKTSSGFKIKKLKPESDILQLTKDEKSLYNRYKYSASERGYIFELPNSTFKRLIYSNCYYCGVSPEQKHGNLLYNGIDRLENDKGYQIDNCLACCKVCNRGKSSLNNTDYMNHCIKVAIHLYPQLNAIVNNDPFTAAKLRVEQLAQAGLVLNYNIELEKSEPIAINYKIQEKEIQDNIDEHVFYLKNATDKLNKEKH